MHDQIIGKSLRHSPPPFNSASSSTTKMTELTEPPSPPQIKTSRQLRADARAAALPSAADDLIIDHGNVSCLFPSVRNRRNPQQLVTTEGIEQSTMNQTTTSRQRRADGRGAALSSAADQQNIDHGRKRPAPGQETAWATS